MAKNKENLNVDQDLLALAIEQTIENTSKGRSGSGRITYLDRFVNCQLDENGKPLAPVHRKVIMAMISLEICQEKRAEDQASDETIPDFTLTKGEDTEDNQIFKAVNSKVKHQVAAAISDSQNSTALSYNEKYKNVWVVVKGENSLISLASVN